MARFLNLNVEVGAVEQTADDVDKNNEDGEDGQGKRAGEGNEDDERARDV
jgi:hypothetical protein